MEIKTLSNSFCEDSIERFHKMYIDAITSKILAHQNSKGSSAPLPVPNAYPSAGSVPPSAPRMRDVSFSVSSKWNCMRYMLFTFGFFQREKAVQIAGLVAVHFAHVQDLGPRDSADLVASAPFMLTGWGFMQPL